MEDFYQRAERIVKSIADAIDAADDEGVTCLYPTVVSIDGVTYGFTFWLNRESHEEPGT